jgi:hypothetical protein
MSAGQAVLVVGVSLVIIAVVIAVMIRLERVQRRWIQRRREAWKAAGSAGPCPGTGYYGPTGFYSGGGFGPPGGGGFSG